MRNTLLLLDEMRMSALSTEDLKSDVCKEIYYSSKDVKKQLQRKIKLFTRSMESFTVVSDQVETLQELIVSFLSMIEFIDE